MAGQLGQDVSIEQGYQAARLTGINQLAALKAEVGDLNKVKRMTSKCWAWSIPPRLSPSSRKW